MNDIQQLEMLSESIRNEIQELESLLKHSDNYLLKAKKTSFQTDLTNIISNLESANDSVYRVYEDLNAKDNEKLINNHNILLEILNDKLSDEEKLDVKLRYGIEL